MKKFLSLILAVVFVVGICASAPITFTANAENVDDLVFELDVSSYNLVSCSETASGEVVIPSMYKGLPVSSIYDFAFSNCTSITSVIIPDTVSRICTSAFIGCTSLKNITIPDSVTVIENGAFTCCYALETMVLPKKLKSVGYQTFGYCTSLKSVEIPGSVSMIDESAFEGCSSLGSINVSTDNTYYKSVDGVLFNKSGEKLIKYPQGKKGASYVIPGTVTKITERAFEDCMELKKVVIPDSVVSIGRESFHWCLSLEDITIGKNVKDIGVYAFAGTGYYTNASNWENNVLYIGEYLIEAKAYDDMSDNDGVVGTYTIKDGTKCIADNAFAGCYDLNKVIMPSSLRSIGNYAFYECSDLTELDLSSSKNITSIGSYVLNDSEIYADDNNWSSGTLYIDDYLFDVDNSVSGKFTIKSTVKCISDNAFAFNDKLSSINIDSDNKNYMTENGVLFNKAKTTLIKYPTMISAVSYEIPSGVKYISFGAFYKANNLDSIMIPESVQSKHIYGFSCEYGQSCNDVFYGGTEGEWNAIEEERISFWGDTGEELEDTDGDLLDKYSVKRFHYNVTDFTTHTTETVVSVASCGKSGEKAVTCKCGYSYTVEDMGLSHNVSNGVCTRCGLEAEFCIESEHPYKNAPEEDGYYYFYYIKKDGAKRIEITFSEATCLGGYDILYVCDGEGNVQAMGQEDDFAGKTVGVDGDTLRLDLEAYDNFNDAYGFSLSDVKVYYECKHEETYVSEQSDATCEKEGYTGDVYCSLCKEFLREGEVIKKTNHDFENGLCKACGCGFWTYKFNDNYVVISSYNGNDKVVEVPTKVQGLPVTTIGANAFADNKKIEKVVIPDSVTSIENEVFFNCTSLKTIIVPENLTRIGCGAFRQTAYYNNPDNWKDGFLYVGNHLVNYDNENREDVSRELIVKDGTNCIAESAMNYAPIKKAVIPGSVKTINTLAFYDAYLLENVVISNGVTTIEERAFIGCGALKSIEIPESVTTIGERAFGYYYDYTEGLDDYIRKVEGFTIYGKKGTAAETYANENGFKFVETKAKLTLATPVVTVKNSATGVKVTWKAIDGAESYKVYRKTYSTKTKKYGSWKTCGTVTATSYVDTNAKSGTKYIYTVKAVNGDVKSGIKSSSSILFLSQPTVKIANASTGVKVSWNKITGATGYKVYRAEYTNGKWSGWKSVKTIDKGSTVSWTDKSAKSGVKYKYTVKAVNGKTGSTYKSSSSLLYLAQPKVAVKALSNGIKVAWVQSTGATSYKIYRSEYNAKTKKWSSWKSIKTAKSTSKSYVDKSAKKGVKYRYAVKAVNGKVASTYKASSSVKR